MKGSYFELSGKRWGGWSLSEKLKSRSMNFRADDLTSTTRAWGWISSIFFDEKDFKPTFFRFPQHTAPRILYRGVGTHTNPPAAHLLKVHSRDAHNQE